MNTKQIKINKDKIVRLLLALALVFTVSMPVNAAPTELHPEGNPEKTNNLSNSKQTVLKGRL